MKNYAIMVVLYLVVVIGSVVFSGCPTQDYETSIEEQLKVFYHSDAEQIGSWAVTGLGYNNGIKYRLDIYLYDSDYAGVKTNQDGAVSIIDLKMVNGLLHKDGDMLKEAFWENDDDEGLTIAFMFADDHGGVTDEFAVIATGKSIAQ